MNAIERAALAQVPIPVENGEPVMVCVVLDGAGWRTAWMKDGGRHKESFGPVYLSARQAGAAAGELNARAEALA